MRNDGEQEAAKSAKETKEATKAAPKPVAKIASKPSPKPSDSLSASANKKHASVKRKERDGEPVMQNMRLSSTSHRCVLGRHPSVGPESVASCWCIFFCRGEF